MKRQKGIAALALSLLIGGLLLLYGKAEGQSPGYQGVRFFGEYHTNFMPAFKGPTPKRKGPGFEGGFKLNVRHTISTNFIMGRKTAAFLNLDLFRTGLRVDQVLDGERENGTAKVVQRLVFYKMKMRAYEFGLSLHRLNKPHSLTPIGPHFDVGLRILRSKGTADSFWEDDAQNTVLPETPEGLDHKATNGLLVLGLANRHIWYDRFTFTYGIRTGLVLASPGRLSKTDPGGIVTIYDNDDIYRKEQALAANKEAFRKMATLRAQQYHYVQMYVGIGILIY